MLDFLAVASDIVRDDPGLAGCRPAIEKELLHFEILGAMNDAGILRHLTFKGGTCLRLCYGGVRFSEDLDFSGGSAFSPEFLVHIEAVLRERLGRGYGLEVQVKPPGQFQPNDRRRERGVDRWVARVVTRPAGKTRGLGVQRIKIGIDKRAHASEDIVYPAIRHRHTMLQDRFAPFPIRAASAGDICSDKLIAFPLSVATREYPRYRDAWDIEWILGRNVDPEDVAARSARKAVERKIADQYIAALDKTIERCNEIIGSRSFLETLQRFIPRPMAGKTVEDAGFRAHLVSSINSLCESTRQILGKRRHTA